MIKNKKQVSDISFSELSKYATLFEKPKKRKGKSRSIVWFRRDLRIGDNPALLEAVKKGAILPIYIHDIESAGDYTEGAASRVWLHHSLYALNKSLDNNLAVYAGDTLEIIERLIKENKITELQWNRNYEPWLLALDNKVGFSLMAKDFIADTHRSYLMFDSDAMVKFRDGTPYKKFKPFNDDLYDRRDAIEEVLPKPKKITYITPKTKALNIDDLNLLPSDAWEQKIIKHWEVGEVAAQKQIKKFIKNSISKYEDERNFPAKNSTSRISPHLHFGEITPRNIWHLVQDANDFNSSCWKYIDEIVWREFCSHLLYFNPNMPFENLLTRFEYFSWKNDEIQLKKWQQGQTGIPLVDAGMRELLATGFMHNRIRMVTASFLVKNLLIDWKEGAAWFWENLVDANLANNTCNWQWVAGSSTEASPYYRIFNPVLQAQKFDPEGEYIRKFIPEIAKLPTIFIFAPWEAPAAELSKAKITLGETYPKPIVNLEESRKLAFEAFRQMNISYQEFADKK